MFQGLYIFFGLNMQGSSTKGGLALAVAFLFLSCSVKIELLVFRFIKQNKFHFSEGDAIMNIKILRIFRYP